MQITLRAVRISEGYTTDEVASYCGVSTEAIDELETDSSEITYILLTKITELYKVAPDLIYFGAEVDFHKRSIWGNKRVTQLGKKLYFSVKDVTIRKGVNSR